MTTRPNRRRSAGLAIVALVVAACSGEGGNAGRIAFVTVPTTEPTASTTMAPATDDDPTSTAPPTATTPPPQTDPVAPTSTEPAPDDDLADWTFMVYVMGDNDLEPYALADLIEMSQAGSTDDINIVALVDRHPAYDVDGDPLGDFADTRYYRVGPGDFSDNSPVGELNVGSPTTLSDFISGSIAGFPAERYAVVLWNHGAGWPGMGPDETDGNDILDLAEINAGFEAGLAAAGVDKVDLVGFDACLMASYEVATTMADHADFMLASEELEPGHGWNYAALQILTEQPDASPEQLGQRIIDGFAAQAIDEQQAAEITLSLLDLRAMDSLEAALADLAAPLIAQPVEAAPLISAAQSSAMKFGANPDPSLDSFHVDLGDVIASLGGADPVLTDPAAAAGAALDRLVVTQTTGPVTAGASGLSIYFPPYPDTFRQGYLFLEDIPVWPDLLESFFTAGGQIPEAEQPTFVNTTDGEAEYFFDEDGLNIFGYFDLAAQGNLVEAEIFYGVLDESDGSIIFIGEEPGDVSTDGSGLAAAIYDLTVLTISDGVDTDYAYLDFAIDLDSETVFIDVPLWYVAPGDFGTDAYSDVVLSLVLDFEANILSEVYYEIGADGTFGELDADPDGLIYPVLLNQYPDGSQEWVTLSEQGLWANLPDLQYDLEPLESGTGLYAELVLYDYGGNTDSVSMFDFVP